MINKNILYRRNNKGQPCYWYIDGISLVTNTAIIHHGIVGKREIQEELTSHRNIKDEVESKYNDKRKTGYKYIYELKDNNELPVKGEDILGFLMAYLPIDRTTGDGIMLPMLAKTYDNKDNKVFSKCDCYKGQWKINGLRCFISGERDSANLFYPIRLKFQSREGTIWNSLSHLEDYLLSVLPEKLLDLMCDEDFILDGELYLPNHTVNEINHFVKDPTCKENKLIQYWCYDFAIQDTSQYLRQNYMYDLLGDYRINVETKEEHYNNTNRLVVLPSVDIFDNDGAIHTRDKFIEIGFEGLILRNPFKEYQYGARNASMIKFKRSTDGIFTIDDIVSEGIKRPDIPLFILKNDINNSLFEVHLTDTIEKQKSIFNNKDKYIGAKMQVEYGERSGINQVPFHVKQTKIIYDKELLEKLKIN